MTEGDETKIAVHGWFKTHTACRFGRIGIRVVAGAGYVRAHSASSSADFADAVSNTHFAAAAGR